MKNTKLWILVFIVVIVVTGIAVRYKFPSSADGHLGCEESCGVHEAVHDDDREQESRIGHDDCVTDCDQDHLEEIVCEHQTAIIDCDDCRFEVGVVKIAPAVAQSLIRTGVVEEIERQQVLRFTGQIQTDDTRTVEVISSGSGRVERVLKLLGENVQKGEALAVIQSADLGQAKADFLKVQAELELAQAAYQREKELYESKITSRADYLAALNEVKAAEAGYTAAEKRLRLFGLDTGQLSEIIKEKENGDFAGLILRAPQSGTIIAQNIAVGKMVDTTESLYAVTDLSNVWAWCDIYEKDLAAMHHPVHLGQQLHATVQVNAFPQAGFEAAVDFIGNVMDRQTRTVKMRAQVKNPENKLRPGMFADVTVRIPGQGRVIAVPRDAVMSDAETFFVFRHLKDDLWIRRDVLPGRTQDDVVEILKGISPGDQIVVGGAFMLKSEVLKEKMGAGCAH